MVAVKERFLMRIDSGNYQVSYIRCPRYSSQFHAARAVMLVHSFSQATPHARWFEDFAAFGRLFGQNMKPERTQSIGTFEGVEVEIGWCRGDSAFLEKLTP